MYLGEASNKRRKRIIAGITAGLILLFGLAFFPDLKNFGESVVLFFTEVLNGSKRLDEAIPLPLITSDLVLLYNLVIGFLFVFLVWLGMLASQAILPVNDFVDAYRTAFHLLLHLLGLHGPAIFVKDGKKRTTKEDLRPGPGVAVVDFNSAIVIEEQVPYPGIARLIYLISHTILILLGLADRTTTPRAEGPGIVYMNKYENIRGVVDLRKQFRSQDNVNAYTRDGIEVKSRAWSIFTIGEEGDIVQVGYAGDPRPENLRIVTLEMIPENHFRVTGFSDELEAHDRDEIHRFAMVAASNGEILDYQPLRSLRRGFDRDRVFAAVFSEARDDKDNLLSWADLPARVSASIFREMISRINYDELYALGRPSPVPILRYRADLRTAMRSNGILSFRLLMHRSEPYLQLRRVYEGSELRVSNEKPLTYPKVLRDRGIKVIAAGFGDIEAVSDEVYQKRLESWAAEWVSETDDIRAKMELEAIRQTGRARAAAQRDLMTSLNDILSSKDVSSEVLAVRIFQTLDRLAAESKTKDLLPGGTVDVLKTTREWLLPNNALPPGQPNAVMPIDGDEL